jgi:hypothetical protein
VSAERLAKERAWVRRVLTDPTFRIGADVRREELVDVLANRIHDALLANAEGKP